MPNTCFALRSFGNRLKEHYVHAHPRVSFGRFYLDSVNQRLRRGRHEVALTPKAYAVLTYLVTNADRLVTKSELLQAVWTDGIVSDASLKVCIREIRKALGDRPQAPLFIRTLHRRGYRFIAEVSHDSASGGPARSAASMAEEAPCTALPGATQRALVVGRQLALAELQNSFQQALRSERQVVFVTGEAGIGKTALVEAFLDQVANDRQVRIIAARCWEQYGAGEPYLPVLEALSELAGQPGHQQLTTILAHYAPTWLLRMPSLAADPSEQESLSKSVPASPHANEPRLLNASETPTRSRIRRGPGARRKEMGGRSERAQPKPQIEAASTFNQMIPATLQERMLREMSEALEALTTGIPLVLVLEDLHACDYSTLDLLASLAHRRGPARLLLIGTYRPVEAILDRHPVRTVKQHLQAHGRCRELALDPLSEAAVGEYLATRFPASRFRPALARVIWQRTEGHPLFMVNAVDHLVAEKVLRDQDGIWMLTRPAEAVVIGIPKTIVPLIEQQCEGLSVEFQVVLEAASVAGPVFCVAPLAAALEQDEVSTEARCQELSRRHQFLCHLGAFELPDATVTTRYGFIHSLYREVLYQRVPAARRRQLHQRLSEYLESAEGPPTPQIA